jgi:hypothetical protein
MSSATNGGAGGKPRGRWVPWWVWRRQHSRFGACVKRIKLRKLGVKLRSTLSSAPDTPAAPLQESSIGNPDDGQAESPTCHDAWVAQDEQASEEPEVQIDTWEDEKDVLDLVLNSAIFPDVSIFQECPPTQTSRLAVWIRHLQPAACHAQCASEPRATPGTAPASTRTHDQVLEDDDDGGGAWDVKKQRRSKKSMRLKYVRAQQGLVKPGVPTSVFRG